MEKTAYFGMISGMPIFLVLAVLFNVISIYLAVYFMLFVFATLFQSRFGLVRVRRKDAESPIGVKDAEDSKCAPSRWLVVCLLTEPKASS